MTVPVLFNSALRIQRSIAFIFFLISVPFVSTQAQITDFELIDNPIDYTQYKTMDQCLVAVERIQDSVRTASGIFIDTTPRRLGEDFDPAPEVIARTAKSCIERWPVERADVHDSVYSTLLSLYLYADREEDAWLLIQRKLESSLPLSDSARIRILGQNYRSVFSFRPFRVSLLNRLLVAIESVPSNKNPFDLISILQADQAISDLQGDTAKVNKTARKIIAIWSEFSKEQKASENGTRQILFPVTWAMRTLATNSLQDSLFKSTQSYVAFRQSILDTVLGENFRGAMVFPFGRKAPPIEADFWLKHESKISEKKDSGSTAVPWSVSGSAVSSFSNKISLLVFLWAECGPVKGNNRIDGNCFPTYAVLRRFAEEFPSLDIVVIAHTRGFLGEFPTQPPVDEAKLLADWWLGYHRIRGRLAVSQTNFFRLADPDRRRIDEQTNNLANYRTARGQGIPNGTAVLVDENGIIVESGGLNRDGEAGWKSLINTLTKRLQSKSLASGTNRTNKL